MITFKINDSGFKNYKAKFLNRSRDTRGLMRQIAALMEDSTETNFEVQGRPAWQKLKAATIANRLKRGKAGKILQVSGKLANSINSRYTNRQAVVGTNLIYSRVHQYGYKAKKIPARPYLKLTDRDIDQIIKTVEAHYYRGN